MFQSVQPTSVNMCYVNMAVNQYTNNSADHEKDWFKLLVTKFSEFPVSALRDSEPVQGQKKRKLDHAESAIVIGDETHITIWAVQEMCSSDYHTFLTENFHWKGQSAEEIVHDEFLSTPQCKCKTVYSDTVSGPQSSNKQTLCHDASEYISCQTCCTRADKSKIISEVDVLKATLHPRVVSMICQLLLTEN